MDNHGRSREELIEELEELKRSVNSLKENILVDNTGQVPWEEESLGNISRLAMAMKGGNMAWWEMDISTGRVAFDIRKSEMLGFPAENFKYYWDFTALVHPDDYNMIMDSMKGHFEGIYKEYAVEYRIRTSSGEYVWFYDFGSVVKRDAAGRPLLITGFVYNISARKKIEEQLHKSELMLQTVLDNFPGLVFWKDKESVYLGCNRNFASGAGLKNTLEIVGKSDLDLPWGSTEAANYKLDDAGVINCGVEKLHILEIQHQTSGKVIWLDTSKIPLRDPQGQIVGVIGVSNDISLLKQAEQELIIANKNLTIQIEEKEKQTVELLIAKDRAEESDRLKTAFLANLSHEIRTPLNGILSFSDLLKEPSVSGEDLNEYIKLIGISGERLLILINNIVSISMIESGQMGISYSYTNLNDLIEKVYTTFKSESDQKQLKISVRNSLHEDDSIIKTDNEKIKAILTNMVNNAVKFTSSGFIEFGCISKGDLLEFYVKDSGQGIPVENREFIFERFRQGNESLARGYEGAGLGLSISKAYVEMLGGKIWVESEPGKGSVFYFSIPKKP